MLLDLGSRPTRYPATALLASRIQLASRLPLFYPVGCRTACLSTAALLHCRLQLCSPLGCRLARLWAALLAFWLQPCSPIRSTPARLLAGALIALGCSPAIADLQQIFCYILQKPPIERTNDGPADVSASEISGCCSSSASGCAYHSAKL